MDRRRDGALTGPRSGRRIAILPVHGTDYDRIGPVYTPPELRGRGYARAAVASHLESVVPHGVARSILFTDEANEPARRCYLGLGYEIVGQYGLIFFEGFK